jgi:cysteine synthase
MRLAILAILAAQVAAAGELWVITADGRYDGRRYSTDEQRFRDHHQQYGERCVWLTTGPQQTGTDANDRPVYRAPTAAELAAELYPLPDVVVPLVGTNGVQVGTARIVVDRETMQAVAVVDSASPQKPWAEQRAAAVKQIKAMQTAKKGVNGQLQSRIENIERVLGLRD